MFKTIKYEKSCGIITIHNDQVLLLHYPSGHWDFPKGHVAPSETEEETARRELEEETGITQISIIPGFRHISQYHYRRNRSIFRKKVVYFLGTTPTSTVKISHEHLGFQWLSWQDCQQQLTFENSQNILKKAFHCWQSQQLGNTEQ